MFIGDKVDLEKSIVLHKRSYSKYLPSVTKAKPRMIKSDQLEHLIKGDAEVEDDEMPEDDRVFYITRFFSKNMREMSCCIVINSAFCLNYHGIWFNIFSQWPLTTILNIFEKFQNRIR